MASAGRYKQFLRILEHWPLDKTKIGRDLGAHIREQVAKGFKHGEATQVDGEQCDRYLASLAKIQNNDYKTAFPRSKTSTASGLSLDECRRMTSTDTLVYLREDNASMWERFRRAREEKTKTKS